MLISIHSVDILPSCAVVELASSPEGNVPKAVPLGATLRIHAVDVIVGDARVNGFDVMDEGLTVERWNRGDVKWKAGEC